MKIAKRQLRRIIREEVSKTLQESHPRPDDDYDPLNPDFEPPSMEEDAEYDRGFQDGFDGQSQDPAGGLGYYSGYEQGENAYRDEEIEQGIEGRALHRGLAGMED